MTRRNVFNTLAALAAAPVLLKRTATAMPMRQAFTKTSLLTRASVLTGIPVERVKITGWRPDTCGCELQYVWDRATLETPEVRVHYPLTAVCCEHHACHTTPEAAYSAVLAENKAKNVAVAELAARHNVEPHAVAWEFDASREVSVRLMET